MTSTLFSRAALGAAFAIAFGVITGAASAQQLRVGIYNPPPPPTSGFKATNNGGGTQAYVEFCNNIASCNLMIAYCAGHGGDWKETGRPGPEGQPQQGQCTYPD